jgi:RNA polymerase sigma factor (sigma-70 family)
LHRDPDKAVAFLRATVVKRSQSILRHRVAVDDNPPDLPPPMRTAEDSVTGRLDQTVAAFLSLPPPQREVIVLHYFQGLPFDQIAAVMGIRQGTVISHLNRGLASVRAAFPRQPVAREGSG